MLDRIMAEPFMRVVCVLGLYVGSLAGYVMFLLREAILFAPLLRRLPAPPGAVHETEDVGPGEEFSHHSRMYDVEQPYLEVADFFKAEFPKHGWRLVEEDAQVSPGQRPPEGIASVQLIFRGPYIMPWRMGVQVLAGLQAGVQTGRTHVGIDDPNSTAESRAEYR